MVLREWIILSRESKAKEWSYEVFHLVEHSYIKTEEELRKGLSVVRGNAGKGRWGESPGKEGCGQATLHKDWF